MGFASPMNIARQGQFGCRLLNQRAPEITQVPSVHPPIAMDVAP
jgi:hypothetical protein